MTEAESIIKVEPLRWGTKGKPHCSMCIKRAGKGLGPCSWHGGSKKDARKVRGRAA